MYHVVGKYSEFPFLKQRNQIETKKLHRNFSQILYYKVVEERDVHSLRCTSGATPANLLTAGMATVASLHASAEVGLGSRSKA